MHIPSAQPLSSHVIEVWYFLLLYKPCRVPEPWDVRVRLEEHKDDTIANSKPLDRFGRITSSCVNEYI